MISDTVRQAWLPPKYVPAVEWIPNNVRLPEGSEYDGYFSFDLAPHTRAVLELWDDPTVREISLCWATRNMKTSTMVALAIFCSQITPRPMAFGSCDEMSVDRTIDEMIYPMLDRCEATRSQLLPPSRRSRDSIRLRRCRIRKAFGGSKSSVAGYSACYVFLNELDKWPLKKLSEADPARGFTQRVKGYPYDSKIIRESTPGEIDSSRIWAELSAESTDRRQYYVPCPLCDEYQVLEWGGETTAYGVKWDRDEKGRSNPLVAERTAHYQCRHCQGRIESEDRAAMMRRGVWLSEGQRIDRRGMVSGKRAVRSSSVALGPLSSLYSLLIKGWGQLAAEWVKCGHDVEKIKDFQTSTLALPWDPRPKKIEIPELAQRLCSDSPISVCPTWVKFLTRGVDVQDNGETYVWVVLGWGDSGRGAVIDYGVSYSQKDFIGTHRTASYPHADGGPPLHPSMTLIDSGDETDVVYQLCRQLRQVLPCKGSSTSNFAEAYQVSRIEEDAKALKARDKIRRGGVVLVMVNTHRSQKWLQKHIDGETHGLAPFELPKDVALDHEFLRELCDDTLIDGKWIKESCNDYRDATRYGWTAAMYYTNGGADWERLPPRATKPAPSIAQKPPRKDPGNWVTSGGGREWDT